MQRNNNECGVYSMKTFFFIFYRGDNVEDAFLETAKKIFQSIQDGR